MKQHHIRRGVFVSLLGGMFMLGFVSGSVTQRSCSWQRRDERAARAYWRGASSPVRM